MVDRERFVAYILQFVDLPQEVVSITSSNLGVSYMDHALRGEKSDC